MTDYITNYLNELVHRWGRKYTTILVYGAGGVARDFLSLIAGVDTFNELKDKLFVVVSNVGDRASELQGIGIRQIDEFEEHANDSLVIIATMPVLVGEIEAGLRNKGFAQAIDIDLIIKDLYKEIWKAPVSRNKIIFRNFVGGGFGGNSKYVFLELLKRQADLDYVWLVNDPETEMPDGIRKVQYGTLEHYWELGTAAIWIDDQHKSFLSRKRERQYYIQTWHGIGPTKKIEFDAADTLPRSYLELCEFNSRMEDLFVSGSGFNTEMCPRGFHYYGEVLECGYPRNDLLVHRTVDEDAIRNRLNIPEKYRTFLYAPTYRNDGLEPDQGIDIPKVCSALEQRFGEEFICLVRFHPYDPAGREMSFDSRMINVTEYDDVQELLYISDVLIADYSSIMWDFSLQMKPVFMFHPNNDEYQAERGTYISPEHMPYVIAISNDDLCDKVMMFDEENYMTKLSKYFDEYQSLDKGKAAATVADRIISFIEKGKAEDDSLGNKCTS